jgi:hypothetical protein
VAAAFHASGLVFSALAAYAAPLILLAQTRQADREKVRAEIDARHREQMAAHQAQVLEQDAAQTEQIARLLDENRRQTDHIAQLVQHTRRLLERESDQTDLIASLASQTIETAQASHALTREIHAHTVTRDERHDGQPSPAQRAPSDRTPSRPGGRAGVAGPGDRPRAPSKRGARVSGRPASGAAAVAAARSSEPRVHRGVRRIAPLLGPAFVACIAYVDPGNFATNIQSGAEHGYLLLWVIVAANLMAMLVQHLTSKLGIATGRSLPELCRDRFPRRVTVGLWLQGELIAIATDLAEFVGAAIGLNLLFGIPLFPAGVITAIVSFAVLGLEARGRRRFERMMMFLLGVITLGFLYDTLRVGLDPGATARGLVPAFDGSGSVLLATGILGATVMPHVICFLLAQILLG